MFCMQLPQCAKVPVIAKTCSTVGLVTQKKDGNCIAVLRDRIFKISLSFSAVFDDSGSLFFGCLRTT